MNKMKKEYDFSTSIKGKFFIPKNEIELPIYLEQNIKEFYLRAAEIRNVPLTQMINTILKKEMEIRLSIFQL